MRILSIGNFGTSWDGSICDEKHIATELARLGHSVTQHSRENRVLPDGSYDFVLLSQWDGYPTDLVPFIRQIYPGVPVVYWAFDYQADGQEWHERLVAGADLYLSKLLSDSKYPNWQWLPADFAPEFLADEYHKIMACQKDIDVLFTGTDLPWCKERQDVLKAVDAQYNLHVYSATPDSWRAMGLKNVHGLAIDRELPQLIGRAKVNLSIDLYNTPGFWSDRNAQIMACGGMVLFRYVPMSEMVFRDNVAYFYGVDDCLEQIDKYLHDDFAREHMAAVGRKYAEDYLMVNNRVKDLLTIVRQII